MNLEDREPENRPVIAKQTLTSKHAFEWPDDQLDLALPAGPDVKWIQGEHILTFIWRSAGAIWPSVQSSSAFSRLALRCPLGCTGRAVRVCTLGGSLLGVTVASQTSAARNHRRGFDRLDMRPTFLISDYCTARCGGGLYGRQRVFENIIGQKLFG